MLFRSQPGENLTVSENLTPLFPDYSDAVVPVNIAPLNFRVPGAEKIYVVIDGMNGRIEVKGKNRADFPIREWRRLLKENAGMSLNVSVYALNRSIWNKYRPFTIHVKNDPVDQWLVYRLVAPGYEAWSEMGIYQRDVTSFDEEPVIDNRLLPGSCMNCHSFNQNNPAQMVFHLRGNIGATILGIDGETVKLNTKTEETISNCVYPYWHPSGNYIGFSVNNISQVFHSRKEKRIEVIDSR